MSVFKYSFLAIFKSILKGLTKRVPFYYFIIAGVIISILLTLNSYSGWINFNHSNNYSTLAPLKPKETICGYTQPRLSGYEFIKPLMFIEQDCESEKYAPLKQSLINIIEKYKSSGAIISASVYVEEFEEEAWICINNNEQYIPASLLKLPLLVTMLHVSEDNPSILNRVIRFDKPSTSDYHQAFNSKSIVLGHNYTIKELLEYI